MKNFFVFSLWKNFLSNNLLFYKLIPVISSFSIDMFPARAYQ